jgi:hypothetical protein
MVGGAQITQIWMASPVIVIEPMAMQNGGTARLWVPGLGTRGEQLAKGR